MRRPICRLMYRPFYRLVYRAIYGWIYRSMRRLMHRPVYCLMYRPMYRPMCGRSSQSAKPANEYAEEAVSQMELAERLYEGLDELGTGVRDRYAWPGLSFRVSFLCVAFVCSFCVSLLCVSSACHFCVCSSHVKPRCSRNARVVELPLSLCLSISTPIHRHPHPPPHHHPLLFFSLSPSVFVSLHARTPARPACPLFHVPGRLSFMSACLSGCLGVSVCLSFCF